MHIGIPIFSLVLISTTLTSFADLKENSHYQDGLAALQSHLPAQAVKRFDQAVKDASLTEQEKVQVLLRLCEAQVRSRQGAAAQSTLNHSLLTEHPARSFWLGQALFEQGKNAEAVTQFTQSVSQKNEFQGLALMALSGIYESLNEREKSLDALAKASKLPQVAVEAKLALGQLHLESGELKEATKALVKLKPKKEKDKLRLAYLNAQLALLKKDTEKATEGFSGLLKTEHLHPLLKEGATLGLADAYAQSGDNEKAVALVVDLVKQDLDSPSLHLMFNRLIDWSAKMEDLTSLNETLVEWGKLPEQILVNPENGEENKVGEPEIKHPDLHAFSHYALAKNYALSGKETDQEKALDRLKNLRKFHPMHSLYGRSILLSAKIEKDAGDRKAALKSLQQWATFARTLEEKARAKYLVGLFSAEVLDDEAASKAFSEAIKVGETVHTESAKVNMALLQLRNRNIAAFMDTVKGIDNAEIKADLLFERAVRAVHKGLPNGRKLLEEFVSTHKEGERVASAKLLLAEELLAFQPIDPKRVKQIVAELRGELGKHVVDATRLNELELRLLIFDRQWEKAVAIGEQMHEQEPDSERLILTLGEAYYRNGEFNKSRKILAKIITAEKQSSYLEYAYFFSALAARKESTPQSKQEAVVLLGKALAMKGALHTEAVIQQARLLIDLEQLEDAKALLEKTLKKDSLSSSVQKDLKVLLADALHRLGGKKKNPEFFAAALKLYEELLTTPKLSAVWTNRLLFLKAQTQEKVDPTFSSAIDTYLKVIHLEQMKDKKRPAEWHWYLKAGLRCVDLLEKQERWKAAAAILETMSEYGGPKSDVLKERARKIKLTHHIW